MGRPRKEYYECQKCKIELSEDRRHTYCKSCISKLNRFRIIFEQETLKETDHNDKMWQHLFEFVERIEKRNQMASFSELFVELITLHNHFTKDRGYKNVSPNAQLQQMWRDLQIINFKTKK